MRRGTYGSHAAQAAGRQQDRASPIARSSRSPSRCDSGLDVGYPVALDWEGRHAFGAVYGLMVVAAASHAQPTAAPTPTVKAPAALRNADEASEKSKLEAAAAKTKKLDDAEAARQRKLADEKIARTEANWKKVMGSICTGCVPRTKPVPVSR